MEHITTQEAGMVEPTRIVRDSGQRWIEPRHGVRDEAKLAALITDMDARGWVGRPVLAYYDGDGLYALTGSHRLAAAHNATMEIDVPVYVIDLRGHRCADESGDCWCVALTTARDDDGRVAALRGSGDADALTLMLAEITT